MYKRSDCCMTDSLYTEVSFFFVKGATDLVKGEVRSGIRRKHMRIECMGGLRIARMHSNSYDSTKRVVT